MNKEIIKLSILVFLAGFLCKIYDDLNDNDLFQYFLLDKNKEYINEFLKALHYILLTYVSSTYIYPLLIFVIPNILIFFKDSKAVEMPYEYSGIIAFSIFSIYLIINNFSILKTIFNCYVILFLIMYIGGTYIFDTLLCKNIEYGYKKIAIRGFSAIFIISALLINYWLKYLPDELTFGVWYIIGYCLTSCFFQMFLIWKSKQTPHDTPEQTPLKHEMKHESNKQNAIL